MDTRWQENHLLVQPSHRSQARELRPFPDQPRRIRVGTGYDRSDVRWVSDVQSGWPETGLGVQSARYESARDQRLHRGLGELALADPDLPQVVLQMRHVIAHEIVQCGGLVMRNWFPRKLVEIMSCPFAMTFVFRRGLHDARDVQVEISPKIDQLVPRRFAVSLQRNPGILLITIKQKIFF